MKCPILKEKQIKIIPKKYQEIKVLQAEICELEKELEAETSMLNYYQELSNDVQKQINKVTNLDMKLNEAAKFSDYKYTKEDIQLYADSIKTLDSFSGFYIMQWLNNLSLIINDLLKSLNISVEFSAEKDFVNVNNAGQKLNYAQLSSGQKTFLNAIFKIGILLNEGISDGLLLIDEGINTIDNANFLKLLEILNTLNFQSIIIYQNCPKELDYISYINVERKNGLSSIS